MTNRELQELLSKFPNELEIEVYDKANDYFFKVDVVRIDDIWSWDKGYFNVVQIAVEEKE